MCAVSAVTDYHREKWPLPNYLPNDWLNPKPSMPYCPTPNEIVITWEQWQEYQELKKRMEAHDKATGQPDCVKPEVSVWEEANRKIVQEEIKK